MRNELLTWMRIMVNCNYRHGEKNSVRETAGYIQLPLTDAAGTVNFIILNSQFPPNWF